MCQIASLSTPIGRSVCRAHGLFNGEQVIARHDPLSKGSEIDVGQEHLLGKTEWTASLVSTNGKPEGVSPTGESFVTIPIGDPFPRLNPVRLYQYPGRNRQRVYGRMRVKERETSHALTVAKSNQVENMVGPVAHANVGYADRSGPNQHRANTGRTGP